LAESTVCSGRAVHGRHKDKGTGAEFQALRLYGLQVVHSEWLRIPTLALDATADMRLILARVPHAELVADIAAASPHMRVVQYVGKTFGKGALGETKTVMKAWHWAVAHATRRGGNWLIVMQKDAAAAITCSKSIPSFIRLEYFGNLRGLDAYGDVAGM